MPQSWTNKAIFGQFNEVGFTVLLEEYIKEIRDRSLWREGEANGPIRFALSDSRELKDLPSQSVVFFARKGVARDGHDFLKDLASHPAIAAFVVEREIEYFKTSRPVIRVSHSTEAMAYLVKRLTQDPTSKGFCFAVTGTNGKTTTTFLVQALLAEMGNKVARLGTIEAQFEGQAIPSNLTTPDFTELQKIFSDFVSRGANAFVLEASSHALEQKRLLGLELDAALFTNLTAEHLDYHRTMEAYYLAKKKLFSQVLCQSQKSKRLAVIPLDGAFGSRLADELKDIRGLEILSWEDAKKATKGSSAQWILKNWKTDLSGSEFEVFEIKSQKTFKFKSPLVGSYNIENLMGMVVLARALNAESAQIQQALDKASAVPGRLERVSPQGPGSRIFVDYAHTPDALENVLNTLRPLTQGKLIVVFGCGGDRDRAKRPQMGAIAELYADEIFVTSDNPRTEKPEEIIEEILTGLQRLKPIHIDPDRRKTIERSVSAMGSQDVILIAGKGHETYQILGTEKIPFDDRQIAREALTSSP